MIKKYLKKKTNENSKFTYQNDVWNSSFDKKQQNNCTDFKFLSRKVETAEFGKQKNNNNLVTVIYKLFTQVWILKNTEKFLCKERNIRCIF